MFIWFSMIRECVVDIQAWVDRRQYLCSFGYFFREQFGFARYLLLGFWKKPASRSYCFIIHTLKSSLCRTMSVDGERTCPLCTEEMDLTDQQLKPCKCRYEVWVLWRQKKHFCSVDLKPLYRLGLQFSNWCLNIIEFIQNYNFCLLWRAYDHTFNDLLFLCIDLYLVLATYNWNGWKGWHRSSMSSMLYTLWQGQSPESYCC